MRLDDRVFPGGTGILNSFPDTIKPYRGSIKNNQFKIRRLPNGIFDREAAVVITGRVFNSSTNTIIQVKMRCNFLIMIFLAVWLMAVSFVTIRLFAQMINEHKFYEEIFYSVLFFAIGYFPPLLLIKDEKRKFKMFMQELLLPN